jgi:hypothetical protein
MSVLLVHKGSRAKRLRVDDVWRGSAGEICRRSWTRR